MALMIGTRCVRGRQIAGWVGQEGFPPDRRTLVFIHGAGGGHTNWICQCRAFKGVFPIAAFDLPGHGRSQGPGESEVDRYVDWIRLFLEAFGIRRPVLIGHSLGAAICLQFALRFGGDAEAMVLAGGGAKLPVNAAILEALRTDPAAVMALVGRVAVAKANRDRLGSRLAASLSRIDPMVLRGDFVACDRMDLTGAVADIRLPTCILCGTEDRMTPPTLSQFLGERIPGAQLTLIENAGHFAMLENPRAFNAALRDFVAALP
jgi:pimeloyl-ACP methyl ester carboxylesterase